MKKIEVIIACLLFTLMCILLPGCKDECDDLNDVCKKCSDDTKSSCNSDLDACEILKGPARKDCCEAILGSWKKSCK